MTAFVRDLLKRIGPGAIVATATIGAGETVLAVRVGAWGGYHVLWLVLISVLVKSFLTLYLLGRYSAVTGEPVAAKLVQFPGPRGWLLWMILLLEGTVAPFVFVVIAVPCGQLMSNVLAGLGVAVSYKGLAILFVSLAIVMGMIRSYEALEKSQLAVCFVLLVGTVTAILLVKPELARIFKGFLMVGYFPPYPDWIPAEIKSRSQILEIASVFGYFGSIPMNYIAYSNWVLIKGWAVDGNGGNLKRALSPLRWDVGFNSIVVLLVTSAFLLAGAAILNPLHRIPNGYDLLTEQAHIFARISKAMIPLYYVTILVALFGTLNALPDIYARGTHSFLQQLFPRLQNVGYRPVMNVFGVAMLMLTSFFIWTGLTPILMIDLVALFSANIGVGLTCVAGVWLDRQLPPERRCSRWIWWAAFGGAVIINLISALSLREVIQRYI